MKSTTPPIKEPLFIFGNILSPVWVRWFNNLFDFVQREDSTLTLMQTTQGVDSTVEGHSPLLNFIPKANDQSTNTSTEGAGVDLVMSVVSKGADQSSLNGEIVNIQTLYWMGV